MLSWLLLTGLRALTDVVGIEAGTVMLDGPQPAGEFVGQRHGSLVVALPLLQVERPGLHWIQRLPAPLLHARGLQHGACAVDQQGAQVGVAASGDPPQASVRA